MHDDTEVIGCIRIEPALNDAERDFLSDLVDSGRTLRGTPTGRGDTDLPFARLAWEPCTDGCCLEWNRDIEDAKWMAESLRFVVDHLLRTGARAQGRTRFDGFTFDHVASGAVLGIEYGAPAGELVTVVDNHVTGSKVPARCDSPPAPPVSRPAGARRPDNVIDFRPRRA